MRATLAVSDTLVVVVPLDVLAARSAHNLSTEPPNAAFSADQGSTRLAREILSRPSRNSGLSALSETLLQWATFQARAPIPTPWNGPIPNDHLPPLFFIHCNEFQFFQSDSLLLFFLFATRRVLGAAWFAVTRRFQLSRCPDLRAP